jgi:hypothetical protein
MWVFSGQNRGVEGQKGPFEGRIRAVRSEYRIARWEWKKWGVRRDHFRIIMEDLMLRMGGFKGSERRL